jgi:hypothetical protein
MPRPGSQNPTGQSADGDAQTSQPKGHPVDQAVYAEAGAQRAGLGLLASLSMAQFMVVLDLTNPSVN